MTRRISVPDRYRLADGQIDTAAIKANIPIEDVVKLAVPKLTGGGDSLMALCPFHEDHRPSLCVTRSTGLFYCHGCRTGGDVIDFVRLFAGVRFFEACEWLVGSNFTAPPATRVGNREAAAKRLRNCELARMEWRNAGPVSGTPADLYLASRGISGSLPGTIRFARLPRWYDDDGRQGPRIPAMVSLCQDVDGNATGIQRLFLGSSGRKYGYGSPRLCLGQIRGGALRLGPEAGVLTLCEGVEDGLSLMRMFPGSSVWVALGSANLPHVALPPVTHRVIIGADADGPGLAAADEARVAFEARGLEVEIIQPRAVAKDFNEEWLLLHA